MLRVLSKSLSTVARAGPATSDSLLSGHRAAAGEILPGVPTYGLLTPRRGMATGRIEQMIAYGDVDLHDKGMMIAEDYYKLNKKRVIYHTPNKLVTGQKGALFPTVHDDTAFTFHSGTGLVVQNHLNGVSVSEALLDKDNWLISKETGEYAFAKLDNWNTVPLTPERELGDFRALHSRFVKILRQTNGRDYEDMLPPDFKDFLDKLIADDLKVQHIICHSFFLPCLSKFLLRVLLDVKLKRPLLTADCPKRNDIKKMFVEMPYVDVEGNMLREIVEKNVFLRSWQKRIDEDKARWSLEEPEKTERALGFDEEKAGWSFMEPENMALSIYQEEARWGLIKQQRTGRPLDSLDPRVQIASMLIGVLRAGCLHYHKPDLPKESMGLLQGITIEKVIRMMNIEFPDFEQRTLELLAEHGLWDHLEIVKLFSKYAARLEEVIERDKVRPAQKAAKSAKARQ